MEEVTIDEFNRHSKLQLNSTTYLPYESEIMAHPSTGVLPSKGPITYNAYRSPYGPKYTVQRHIGGWTLKSATKLGFTLGGFGAAAGVFAIFFFQDIPRVRKDIMQKIPIIGDSYIREIPASDNPF
ncbi:ubiquinol-cytochrome-c reductase complex subunit-domain-containing protein [Bisporella sp. PMI_857]|nr:ubiquinol-cytochrome-c reductase complex subunit-domain-containing protein [Bisporella sp. PMI_857]